jgi:putative ABC transport system permease protein
MYGSMAFYNFAIAGTVTFGLRAMDRGAILIDIEDARLALDREDAAGEILGYSRNGLYDEENSWQVVHAFNTAWTDEEDEYAPIMLNLKEQNDLASMMDYMKMMKGFLVFIFVLPMAIVLWNAGLIGGLRRYGEVGVRLAIGEPKGHVYRSMLVESITIGVFGSILGTLAGLALAWPLQKWGISMGDMMKNATIMFPTTFRAHITQEAYTLGFVPGILSTVLGTSLSGIGIYKRKTAQLFKELEA